MNWPVIIIICCFIAMFLQDVKHRHIHVLLPGVVFGTGIFNLQQNYLQSLLIIGYNCAFLSVTFFVLIMYINLKNKQFVNPFKNYFGLGDLLFYIAVSPFFLLYNYILFFTLSMLFAILIHTVLKKIVKQVTIPLAGYASLLLVFIICKDVFLHYPKLTLINQ